MENFDLREFDCYYDDYLRTPIDSPTRRDLDNSNYILSMIPNTTPKVYISTSGLGKVTVKLLDDAFESFLVYGDSLVLKRVDDIIKNSTYYSTNGMPFYFTSKFVFSPDTGLLKPSIITPSIVDDVSSIYLAHEIHHMLKDSNLEERKIRDRLVDTIPIFFELVMYDKSDSEFNKKEIISSRLTLLSIDKQTLCRQGVRINKCMQYFNSYYYALCLYSEYKKNPSMVLRLVSKVLTHVITTEELLKLLDIYSGSLDDVVSDEFIELMKVIK